MGNWKEYRLGEMIACNPQVKLEKGKQYNLVDIDSIEIGSRYVAGKELTTYEGQSGCHFQNGDTVMARITPCLENGKIAQVQCESEKGFGSTELFVFRGIDNKTDTDYVFNLMSMQFIRNLAANSMTGASGRQRADLGFIKRIKWNFPPLPTQRRIASILSTYDALIQNYKRQIAALQSAASELYKEWFVRFRFPGYKNAKFDNGLPEGWKYLTLNEIANVVMGQSPESCYYNDNKNGLPFHQGAGSYGDFYLIDGIYSTEGLRIAEPGSIIFSVRAPVGKLNITINKIILGRGVAAINSKEKKNGFLFWSLKTKFSKEDMIGNGSVFASVTKDELLKQKLLIPTNPVLNQYDEFASNIEKKIRCLHLQITNLTTQRDLLLPRLMSGKLSVE